MHRCLYFDGCGPVVVNTSRSFPHSWLITGFVSRLTRREPLVEQELRTLLDHLSSPPIFSGVRVARSLVLCVCFVERCLSFFCWPLCCLFFFDLWIQTTTLVSTNSSLDNLLNSWHYRRHVLLFIVACFVILFWMIY